MALYIRRGETGAWREWHIGESLPETIDHVMTFQADGDELNMFLEAMTASRGEHPRVDYGKMAGFTAKQIEMPKAKQYRVWYTSNSNPTHTVFTDVVRKTRHGAARWIAANPPPGGTWSIKEEEISVEQPESTVYGELARPEND